MKDNSGDCVSGIVVLVKSDIEGIVKAILMTEQFEGVYSKSNSSGDETSSSFY